MKHETLQIQVEGSLSSTRFITYFQDDHPELTISKRPLVIICPGGAYRFTSEREAEPLALSFLARGYQAAILHYSVAPAPFPVALQELAKVISLCRENAEEWNIEIDQIAVLGFSAGGHLAASLGCYWNHSQILGKEENDFLEMGKPNALLLGYPVISSEEFAHLESFQNLLANQTQYTMDTLCLDKHVTGNFPSTFLWHTYEDDSVPLENSILLFNQLRKYKIPAEMHLFQHGPHGLSLSNRLTQGHLSEGVQKESEAWFDLAITWLDSQFNKAF